MRALLAAAGALALHGQHATASDITLKLDVSVFGLDLGGDGGGGGGGGGMGSLLGNLIDDDGNLIVIDDGTPNDFVLGLTTLVPIPDSYQGVTLDEATMQWSSPSELAYAIDVSLMNIDAHREAGWIAEEIMSVPTVSVPASGRLPATAESFTVALACVTPGKVRMQFQFKVCEEPAAVWDAGSSGCSEGAAQTVTFVVDKECGDSNALPDFCLPASPRAMIQLGEPAAVSVFNLNVAEGAGVDRTKLVAKGTAIAAVIEQKGSDVACLQEVWDEGEKGALTAGLATAGLSHTVYARGAGLLIASRYPIVRCGAATFPADSYGDTIESFSQKGVLGALLDIGGGALLYLLRTIYMEYLYVEFVCKYLCVFYIHIGRSRYVFVTHMAAFSELSGSQAQLATIKQEMQSRISEAAAIYGPAGRIGVVVMGDFNLNAATPEVRTGQTRCFTRKSQTKSV